MEKFCVTCEKSDQCNTPCKAVDAILWADNRVMERHFSKTIICYPKRGEVHFSELEDYQLEEFSNDDVIPWSSGDLKKRQSTVFVERFFNKVPCKELAERFGVKENTIVCMYKQAIEQLEKIVDALDARREGLKATKSGRFTDDEKMFLLVEVFGFNRVEVARMFNRPHKVVCARLKRMSDRYGAAFSGQAPKRRNPY
jgi:DNA-directed RNA polymerase specialized sigma24 family protein